jgi:hypothetical protein
MARSFHQHPPSMRLTSSSSPAEAQHSVPANNARDEQAEEALRRTRKRLAQAESDCTALRKELNREVARMHAAAAWGCDLEARLLAVHASTSWRVTAPLRWVGGIVQQQRQAPLGGLRRLVRRALVRLTSNERLRKLLIPVLLRFPRLALRVNLLIRTAKQADAPPEIRRSLEVPQELRDMPPQARRVLADLRRARSHSTDN